VKTNREHYFLKRKPLQFQNDIASSLADIDANERSDVRFDRSLLRALEESLD
jgi:hypothetical protein